MAFQLSMLARNNILDGLETFIGTSAVLKIRTGAPPATCDTADSGTVLATLSLFLFPDRFCWCIDDFVIGYTSFFRLFYLYDGI